MRKVVLIAFVIIVFLSLPGCTMSDEEILQRVADIESEKAITTEEPTVRANPTIEPTVRANPTRFQLPELSNARPPLARVESDIPTDNYNKPAITFPLSGTKQYYIDNEPLAPLEIKTPIGTKENYYVVLANYYGSNTRVVALYVKGGDSIEILVPLGTYRLFYATGLTWYGDIEYFGPFTGYSKSDDLLEFSQTDDFYNGYTITLYSVYDGNMETEEIDKSEFPK